MFKDSVEKYEVLKIQLKSISVRMLSEGCRRRKKRKFQIINCYHGPPLSPFMIISILTIFSSLKSSALVSELQLKPHSKSTQQPNMNIIYFEASENALLKFSMKKNNI